MTLAGVLAMLMQLPQDLAFNPPQSSLRFPSPSLNRRTVIWAYLFWCPLVFGLVLGWFQAGTSARNLDWWSSIAFWIPLSMIRWSGEFAGTALVHRLLRSMRPSLESQLVLGVVAGGALSFFPARLFMTGFLRWSGAPALRPLPWDSPLELLTTVVTTLTGISILWFATTELFERVFGFRRFSYDEATTPVSTTPGTATAAEGPASAQPAAADRRDPAFAAHLTTAAFSDVVALEAQDHYIRAHTGRGHELILYRFRDAIHEISPDIGVQTHRSFWVRRSAITELVSNGYQHTLILSTGARVPVSRSHLNDVRAAIDHTAHAAKQQP